MILKSGSPGSFPFYSPLCFRTILKSHGMSRFTSERELSLLPRIRRMKHRNKLCVLIVKVFTVFNFYYYTTRIVHFDLPLHSKPPTNTTPTKFRPSLTVYITPSWLFYYNFTKICSNLVLHEARKKIHNLRIIILL